VDDAEIVARIEELVEEEHRLERSHGEEPLDEDAVARLRDLEVRLDQCWDLLRRRRARREAGQDPDEEKARPAGVVEQYRQ
jgi:hypothetical protein